MDNYTQSRIENLEKCILILSRKLMRTEGVNDFVDVFSQHPMASLLEKSDIEYFIMHSWKSILVLKELSLYLDKQDADELIKQFIKAYSDKHSFYYQYEEKFIMKNNLKDLLYEYRGNIKWNNHDVYKLMGEYTDVLASIIDSLSEYLNWSLLSRYVNVPENIIKDHIDEFDFSSHCRYNPINYSFVKKYEKHINFDELSKNKNGLNGHILNNYRDKLNWENIRKYKVLTNEQKTKYKEVLNEKFAETNSP